MERIGIGMQFGKYECASVALGEFLLDGGTMFGIVPKVLWQKQIPTDDQNRIRMNMRGLLIRGQGRTILVDLGIGTKLPPKMKKIHAFDDERGDMNTILAPHDLTPADITDVIITHLHFDHVGGATIMVNGEPRPTFPNATYYVQKAQFETAMNPHRRDLNSFPLINFKPLHDAGVLKLLDGPGELYDDIELIVTHGHTAGQQHPLIKGETQSLFFCADLIPSAAHLPLAWIMAYDNLPMDIMDEKHQILERARDEAFILMFCHDCNTAAASIRCDDQDIIIKETFNL